MNYRELVRAAMQPGPMQDMALQALAEEYAADDRVDKIHGRNQQFDFPEYGRKYIDEYVNAPHAPAGDSGDDDSELRRNWAMQDLEQDYDKIYPTPWYETAKNYAGAAGDYLTSKEGIVGTGEMLGSTFLPVYSQLDSAKFAAENWDKYINADKYNIDPLMALGYLPNAVLGSLGTIPGVSSLMSGSRKLGRGAQTLIEGMF